MLQSAGHDVTGLDSGLFEDCVFPGQPRPTAPVLWCDVRDVTPEMLAGFDAVLHLAGMSNDPYGDLNPAMTDEVNHLASVRLARAAKAAGVRRFVYASSCSNYGSSDDGFIDEEAPFNPVTPYAVSKVMSEANIGPLADADFSPVYLRAGTAYGISAKLRADLVVNNLTGYAFTTGHVMMKSDGMPWRPLVHIDDIAAAYLAVLEAPREQVHNQAFNVGATQENYRVREVATLVAEVVPGATVSFASGAGPDARNYRVNCDKIRRLVPGYRPQWTCARGSSSSTKLTATPRRPRPNSSARAGCGSSTSRTSSRPAASTAVCAMFARRRERNAAGDHRLSGLWFATAGDVPVAGGTAAVRRLHRPGGAGRGRGALSARRRILPCMRPGADPAHRAAGGAVRGRLSLFLVGDRCARPPCSRQRDRADRGAPARAQQPRGRARQQ